MPSTRPSPRAWGWAWRSAVRSSRPTADSYGPLRMNLAAPSFSSPSRWNGMRPLPPSTPAQCATDAAGSSFIAGIEDPAPPRSAAGLERVAEVLDRRHFRDEAERSVVLHLARALQEGGQCKPRHRAADADALDARGGKLVDGQRGLNPISASSRRTPGPIPSVIVMRKISAACGNNSSSNNHGGYGSRVRRDDALRKRRLYVPAFTCKIAWIISSSILARSCASVIATPLPARSRVTLCTTSLSPGCSKSAATTSLA